MEFIYNHCKYDLWPLQQDRRSVEIEEIEDSPVLISLLRVGTKGPQMCERFSQASAEPAICNVRNWKYRESRRFQFRSMKKKTVEDVRSSRIVSPQINA